jgi:hypothetical protein
MRENSLGTLKKYINDFIICLYLQGLFYIKIFIKNILERVGKIIK